MRQDVTSTLALRRTETAAETHTTATPAAAIDYGEFLTDHYPILRKAVHHVIRRRSVNAEDADELTSAVHLKLVERNYSVLRQFAGRSNLATYLVRVVDRVYIDGLIAKRGKWRPSLIAKRLGPIAVRLEQLLLRDRIPFEEVHEILTKNFGVRQTRDELEQICKILPRRGGRPVRCTLEDADRWTASLPVRSQVPSDVPSADARRLVRLAMNTISDDDCRLLRLRFRDGWTVARIARAVGTDQKALYRRFERIYSDLRAFAQGRRGSHSAVRETPQRPQDSGEIHLSI